MGIKALKLNSVDSYVSDLDPDKNATLVNREELEAWDKNKAKGKGPRPDEVYAHGPNATKYLIATLDSITMGTITDDLTSITDGGGLAIRNADNDIMAARLGLRGWENFVDDDGAPVTFAQEKVTLKGRVVEALSDELTQMIPIPVLRELGREVKSRNSLTSVQAKNSVSASSL